MWNEAEKTIYKYHKADFNKMRNMLHIDWKSLIKDCDNDVGKMWDNFDDLYNTAENECIPKVVIKTGKKRFSVPLDRKTLAKKRKKYRLWKRFLESEEGKIYSEYRRCSNQVRSLTRKATKLFEKKHGQKR